MTESVSSLLVRRRSLSVADKWRAFNQQSCLVITGVSWFSSTTMTERKIISVNSERFFYFS